MNERVSFNEKATKLASIKSLCEKVVVDESRNKSDRKVLVFDSSHLQFPRSEQQCCLNHLPVRSVLWIIYYCKYVNNISNCLHSSFVSNILPYLCSWNVLQYYRYSYTTGQCQWPLILFDSHWQFGMPCVFILRNMY
jgi:hypothetical protein